MLPVMNRAEIELKKVQRLHKTALKVLPAFATAMTLSFSSVASAATEMNISDALAAALQHDPEIRVAYMTHMAEKEESGLAKASLLPTVNFTAGYSYEDSDNIYTDADSDYYNANLDRSSGTLNDTYWRVSLRQPLFDAASRYDYKGAKAYVDASGYRYQRAEQDLTYRLSERYLAVLLSAQQVFLNEQKLNALSANLEQVERELSLGVGDKLNVLEVKSRRDLARSDLLQAKSQLNDDKTLLQNMTGKEAVIPQGWVKKGHQVSYNLPVGNEQDWLDKVAQNYSVQETKATIKQSEITVSSRNAGHYPTVYLNLSYQDRNSEDEQRTRKDFVAGLEMNLPIYQGGKTQASIRQASSRLNAENARNDYISSEAYQQVRLAYSRMSSLSERLSALIESRESSRGYLDAAIRGQSLNLRSQVEVLDAQTRLVDVQLRFADTLNQYLLANLRLHLETGSLDQGKLVEYDQLFEQATQN